VLFRHSYGIWLPVRASLACSSLRSLRGGRLATGYYGPIRLPVGLRAILRVVELPYTQARSITTTPGARTSLFVPELKIFCLPCRATETNPPKFAFLRPRKFCTPNLLINPQLQLQLGEDRRFMISNTFARPNTERVVQPVFSNSPGPPIIESCSREFWLCSYVAFFLILLGLVLRCHHLI
jgi:hypothetical protein